MKSLTARQKLSIATRLILAGALSIFATGNRSLPASVPAVKPAASAAAAKSAPKPVAAKSAPAKSAPKSSAPLPAAGQTVTGNAGVNYSFKLPAGLTLATPAREKPDNFTEYTASSAGGEGVRPFRFEARLAKFETPVDCAIFTQFSEGLTRSFMGEHYFDQSPAALQKIAGAAFRVKLFHKEVPPDFNQKSAAVNVAHYLTTQGDAILSLVFYTDANNEAKGQAVRDTLLKSLRFSSSTGNAVCKSPSSLSGSAPAGHSTSTSAPTPAPSPSHPAGKPASSPK